MRFNVLRELRQPLGSVNTLAIEEPLLRVDGETIRDLLGEARLLRTDRGLLVTVDAWALMDAQCSRCLRDTATPVHIEFTEEYVPVMNADTGAPVRIHEGDTFRIDARFDLDLREGVRQYILMAEPQKPLCRPDCLGFCPQCGADLNAGPHECQGTIDERWSALAGLKNQIDEGS